MEMAHVEKFTRKDISGGNLTRHFERAKNSAGEYHQWGNAEIDPSRSHLNYNLAPDRNQTEFIGERLKAVKCLKRDDVNVMCSWIVTAPIFRMGEDGEKNNPNGLVSHEYEQFFKATYDFLCPKYGGEKNVVSAYVHMDETTPHMHYAFLPVVADKKKGHEKISAKEALGWAEKGLHKFHGEFQAHMEKIFGRDIGVYTGVTAEQGGNKTVTELKRKSAELQAQIKKQELALADLEKQVNLQKSHRGNLKKNIHDLEPKKSSLENNIAKLETNFKEMTAKREAEFEAMTAVGQKRLADLQRDIEEIKLILKGQWDFINDDDREFREKGWAFDLLPEPTRKFGYELLERDWQEMERKDRERQEYLQKLEQGAEIKALTRKQGYEAR